MTNVYNIHATSEFHWKDNFLCPRLDLELEIQDKKLTTFLIRPAK